MNILITGATGSVGYDLVNGCLKITRSMFYIEKTHKTNKKNYMDKNQIFINFKFPKN